MNNWLEILAEAWKYPYPGQENHLRLGVESLPEADGKKEFERFLQSFKRLPLGEREDLYTRTFDLNPMVAPYVGFHTWGETYARGAFLASLNREMHLLGLDPGSELPDHFEPLLRYLAVSPAPLPDALQALQKAIQSMQRLLKSKDPRNPYLHLVNCVEIATRKMADAPALAHSL